MFRKPQPLQLVQKVRQYTSNLYGSTPPICIAAFSWLLSFEERETLQYASHLYCSTPPICTAVRPPFVRQYFWKNTGGWGHRNISDYKPPCVQAFTNNPFFAIHQVFALFLFSREKHPSDNSPNFPHGRKTLRSKDPKRPSHTKKHYRAASIRPPS